MKWFFVLLTILPSIAFCQSEDDYVNQWCNDKGQVEYVLPDNTRVDCLMPEFAVEVDFGHKWAEAIGQSLYYGKMTGRQPAVLLIVKDGNHRFIRRFYNATGGLNIRLFTISYIEP